MSKLILRGTTSGQVEIKTDDTASNGTINIPSSSDTLIGRNTTDILTNKTISGTTNSISLDINNTQINISLDNIAALKALTIRPSAVVIEGKITPNDGGGGIFYWASGNSTTPDDVLFVQPTAGPSGRYIRIYSGSVNVLWWGNNSTALSAALTASNNVLIPSNSTITLTTDVDVTNKNLHIEGTIIGTGKLLNGCITRRDGNVFAVGQNWVSLNNGLQIGGGNPTQGTGGTSIAADGHFSWIRLQPDLNENQGFLAIYSSASAGLASSVNGTGNITRISGTPFTSAWIGKKFYFGEASYKVASVTDVNTMTLQTLAGSAVTFSSTYNEIYHYFKVSGTGTCNVSGSTVTRITGDPFLPFTAAPFTLYINGVQRTVSAFVDLNTYTLSSAPGNVSGATYVFETDIADQITGFVLQKLVGGSEENLVLSAKYDGYHINSQFSGIGKYRKIFIGSGELTPGVLNNQIVVQPGGELTLGGHYGSEAIRVLAPSGTLANRIEIGAAPTGFAPAWRSRGTDANIGMAFDVTGTGPYTFTSHQFGNVELQIFSNGGAAWLSMGSHATDPFITPQGATNSSVNIIGRGTGGVKLVAGDSNTKISINTTGIGLFGTAPIAKQTVTGSRGSNAALQSLLTALAAYGIITDSSS